LRQLSLSRFNPFIYPKGAIMTTLALIMVLVSAFIHATWNLFAKRSGGGVVFLWLVAICGMVLYFPIALFLIFTQGFKVGLVEIIFMVGSAFLHLGYFVLLQRGYRVGDLSVVYPLARGTGPLLSSTLAVLFLGERPTLLAIGGAVLIIGGVFVISGGLNFKRSIDQRWAIQYGLMTGGLIALYTLWDKQAVSVVLIAPLLYDYFTGLLRVVLLTPFALKYAPTIKSVWHENKKAILVVGALSPLSYILVLTALITAPVSYVAPAREISILIATIFGTKLLSEGDDKRRLIAAGAMVLGVIAIAIG
jgi:drug/metabolite transporter (DMT)-like permease